MSEVTIEPGHRETFSAFPRGSRATLIVTSGSLVFGFGDEKSPGLDTGDAVLFQADVSHWLLNVAAHPATAYLITTGGRNNGR